MEIEKLDTRTLNNGTSMPIGKNFFRAKLKDRKQWIEEIAERLRNIQIEHKPALDLIREFDSPDSFFYLDPPYLLNTRSAKQYQYEMTEEDHIQLLETIVHCSAQIMISGYDTPLYNDYLHTWDTLRIPNQTTSGVVREEIVWMNYTHQLSLYDFGIL